MKTRYTRACWALVITLPVLAGLVGCGGPSEPAQEASSPTPGRQIQDRAQLVQALSGLKEDLARLERQLAEAQVEHSRQIERIQTQTRDMTTRINGIQEALIQRAGQAPGDAARAQKPVSPDRLESQPPKESPPAARQPDGGGWLDRFWARLLVLIVLAVIVFFVVRSVMNHTGETEEGWTDEDTGPADWPARPSTAPPSHAEPPDIETEEGAITFSPQAQQSMREREASDENETPEDPSHKPE